MQLLGRYADGMEGKLWSFDAGMEGDADGLEGQCQRYDDKCGCLVDMLIEQREIAVILCWYEWKRFGRVMMEV